MIGFRPNLSSLRNNRNSLRAEICAEDEFPMGRKVIYWVVTGLLALSAVFAGINYLWGSQQGVQAFANVGYPQQLRVLLGIAKLLGGITLIVPGLLTLKEWAYAGFTFARIAAVVAHYLAKDGAITFFPLMLLVLLFVSYFTRPGKSAAGSKAAA
jgi:uncharacterized membrane protein YphA (DoxX/SURF4 family)